MNRFTSVSSSKNSLFGENKKFFMFSLKVIGIYIFVIIATVLIVL